MGLRSAARRPYSSTVKNSAEYLRYVNPTSINYLSHINRQIRQQFTNIYLRERPVKLLRRDEESRSRHARLNATTSCAGVTRRFFKPRFADFSQRKTRRFFTYDLAPYLTNITSYIKRILFTLIGKN
jgi:hypothetical protein